MKKLIIVLLLLSMAVGLVACGEKDTTEQPLTVATEKYAVIIDYYKEYAQSDMESIAILELCLNIANELKFEPYGNVSQQFFFSCQFLHDTSLAFAIHDINKDCVYELIIFKEDLKSDNEGIETNYSINAVYTLKNNKPVLLGAYWDTYTCEFNDEGVFIVNGTTLADDGFVATYVIDTKTTSLKLLEALGSETYDKETQELLPNARWYYKKDDVKTIVSNEEAHALRIIFDTNYPVFPHSPTTYAEYYEYLYIKETS
jgi:hypothetical protein